MTPSPRSRPPRMLDGGRVVCFARLDRRVQRTGKTVHRLPGGELPTIRGLVIVEDQPGGRVGAPPLIWVFFGRRGGRHAAPALDLPVRRWGR